MTEPLPMPSRRSLLVSAAGGSAALLTRQAWATGAIGADTPFTLGVASGDPSPTGIVLWTRLAPQPLAADGGMTASGVAVDWQLAHDEGFARIAGAGSARAVAADGHSVHVEVGGLEPGRRYFYRFIAGGHVSPTGRTRTAPARHAAVDRLRLVFASCQNYEVGHYAAGRHAVADDPALAARFPDAPPARGQATDTLRRFVTDRPGHDRRYAVDCTLLETTLGYVPRHGFDEHFAATLRWYLAREDWWRPLAAAA